MNELFSCKLSCPVSFLVLPILIAQSSLVASHLLVTHVGPCHDALPGVVLVKEFAITTHGFEATVSGELNVTEDVTDGWTVKATMQKCQDIRNRDTCDHFRSFWAVRAGCSRGEDALDSALFQHTVPEIECPVRAGTYRVQGYPVSTSDGSLTAHESKISTSVFGYTLVLEGTAIDRRELFCVEAYLQLLYVRQHNWLGSKRKNQTIPQGTIPQATNPQDTNPQATNSPLDATPSEETVPNDEE